MKNVKMITSSQAAKIIGIHPETFRKWVKSGYASPDACSSRGYMLFDSDKLLSTLEKKIQKSKMYGYVFTSDHPSGQREQPYRNYMCVYYNVCLEKAAKHDVVMACKDCRHEKTKLEFWQYA